MRITLAIPVFNESVILKKAVTQLHRFFVAKKSAHNINGQIVQQPQQHDWHIVIADNGSIDGTAKTAEYLARTLSNVHYIRTTQRGKGLAIRTAWLAHPADVYAFMDADLATNLETFLTMADHIAQNNTDIAIGSRFHKQSKVTRSPMRWLYAHGYRLVAKIITNTRINDLPCGAKMCNTKIAHHILPQTQNTTWFFDSELTLLAEQQGFTITELPVKWNPSRVFPDRTSKAFPLKVVREYLAGLRRIRRQRLLTK